MSATFRCELHGRILTITTGPDGRTERRIERDMLGGGHGCVLLKGYGVARLRRLVEQGGRTVQQAGRRRGPAAEVIVEVTEGGGRDG